MRSFKRHSAAASASIISMVEKECMVVSKRYYRPSLVLRRRPKNFDPRPPGPNNSILYTRNRLSDFEYEEQGVNKWKRRFYLLLRLFGATVLSYTACICIFSTVVLNRLENAFHKGLKEELPLPIRREREKPIAVHGRHTTLDEVIYDWDDVAPSLQPGDLVLLYGTGPISWRIANGQYLYSLMNPHAVRYSHVGVVVSFPQDVEESATPGGGKMKIDSAHPNTHATDFMEKKKLAEKQSGGKKISSSAASAPKQRGGLGVSLLKEEKPTQTVYQMEDNGADAITVTSTLKLPPPTETAKTKKKVSVVVLEAIDNKDVQCQDIHGDIKYNQVQQVDARKRIFGKDGSRWCYNRCCVRRLHGVKWTPDRMEKLSQLCRELEGRPMTTTAALAVAPVSPVLFRWLHASNAALNEISCSELVIAVYKQLGILREPLKAEPVQFIPYHFTQGGEDGGKIGFREGVYLGPEVRVEMPLPKEEERFERPPVIPKKKVSSAS